MKVYQRLKNKAGNWRYKAVKESRGFKTGALTPPFYAHPTLADGRQIWFELPALTFAEAKTEILNVEAIMQAQAKGLTVAELDDKLDADRISIVGAVAKYLKNCETAGKKPRTLSAYRTALGNFQEAVKPQGIRWLEQVDRDVLLKHVEFLRDAEYSPKSIANQTTTVAGFLNAIRGKGNGDRIKRNDRPKVSKRRPEEYTDAEVKEVFAAMTDEERVMYSFFLRTGSREQEVQFASWADVDFGKKLFTVKAKPDIEWTPKDYEERELPLRDDLLDMLREWKKTHGDSRWLFPTKHGNPDGHMLRRLKKIAKRAKLSGRWTLHKFRKTAATRWERNGTRVRDIQYLLGHESLATTEKYLGLSSNKDLRKKLNSGD